MSELPEPIRRGPLQPVGRGGLAPLGGKKPKKLEPVGGEGEKRRRRKKKTGGEEEDGERSRKSDSRFAEEEDEGGSRFRSSGRERQNSRFSEAGSEEPPPEAAKPKGSRKRRGTLQDVLNSNTRGGLDGEDDDEEEGYERLRRQQRGEVASDDEEESVEEEAPASKTKSRKPPLSRRRGDDSDEDGGVEMATAKRGKGKRIQITEDVEEEEEEAQLPSQVDSARKGKEDEKRTTAYKFNSRTIPSSRHENAFIENPITGGFREVDKRGGGNGSKSKGAVVRMHGDRRGATEQFMDGLARFFSAFFLFSQGILAGFSLFLFILTYVRYGGDKAFLQVLSPIALDVERAYIVLSCISLIGACDKYMKDRMADWYNRGLVLRVIDIIAVLMYFLAFLLSLLAVPIEEQVYFSNVRIPGWYNAVGSNNLYTASFTQSLTTWHGLNISRTIFSLVGWLIITFETRSYDINASNWKLHMGRI